MVEAQKQQYPNLFSLAFKDVDDRDWDLEKVRGKNVLLILLQGPDAQYFDTWVQPVRNEIGRRPVIVQPVLDSSAVPKMLWWGVKKMKGSLMREIKPEGLPRVLLDNEGSVFRRLRCMPGHINFVLSDPEGDVICRHLVPLTEPGTPKAAMEPILAELAPAEA